MVMVDARLEAGKPQKHRKERGSQKVRKLFGMCILRTQGFWLRSSKSQLAVRLEVRGVLVGIILCLLGFIVFTYGLVGMNPINAVHNSFLVLIGMFLGIAGLLVLLINVLSGGSFLH